MPCLFCEIIAGRSPAGVVYQDEQLTAVRDIRPQAPTHILIMPNKHIASLAEAQAEDGALLGALMLAAQRLAGEAGLAGNGYRLVVNTGREAGQTVWHLHVHVLGGRAMRWPPG